MQIEELKSLLARFGIRPNKRLGQNFLLSDETLDQIIAAAELVSSDTVLEIGPGLGVLTKRLAEKAGQVIAVEKDRKLAEVLRNFFKNKKHVKIIQGDALFLDQVFPLLGKERGRGGPSDAMTPSQSPPHEGEKFGSYKLVANIPYYITGKLLQNFLTMSPLPNPPPPGEGILPLEGGGEVGVKPSLMVLLLQKEVAERIVAKPGDMSILAVSVQFYADAEIISAVPRENFYPAPDVDSAIVRLRVLPGNRFTLPQPLPSREGNSSPLRGEDKGGGVDEKKFFQLVKLGFSNKRKQLHNNLRTLPNPNLRIDPNAPNIRGIRMELVDSDYKFLLSSLGLNPLCRAEDLSLQDWERLYKKLF